MNVEFCVVINLSMLIYVVAPIECYLANIERSSLELDELLDGLENDRYRENLENYGDIWEEYEFGTGVGNREELFIENITATIDPILSDSMDNYRSVASEKQFFFAGFSDNVFSFYKLNVARNRVTSKIEIKSDRKILTFELLSLPNTGETDANTSKTIFAILCVETNPGTELRWYRFADNDLAIFWSWPVEKLVERLRFFRHDSENRLLVVREAEMHLDEYSYSPIDVYGFDIVDDRPSLWLSQRMTVPKIFDLEICPTYESTFMTLRRSDDVTFYEYRRDGNEENLFHEYQKIASNGANNVICFDSGYITYLATSGRTASLYDFCEGEFHVSDSARIFDNVGEVAWIRSIPMDTYREESILLAQLKNLDVVGFSWNGQGFDRIDRPDFDFRRFDIFRAAIIPGYGFVFGNALIKIDVKLRDEPRPVENEVKRLLETKKILSELLHKQELILDETEARIDQSYFTKPDVTGIWNISNVEADIVIVENEVSFDEISMATKTMNREEFFDDLDEAKDILDDWESKLVEIKSNLANGLSINSTEAIFTGDLIIDGGLDVREILSVTHLTFDNLNGLALYEILQDYYNYDDGLIVEGEKMFETIVADNLNIHLINDVPIADVTFVNGTHDYSKIDFPRLRKLKVEGDLHFDSVNDVDWNELIGRVVMKNQPATISGHTIVEGDLIADNGKIDRLNGLRYPQDYVPSLSAKAVNLTGHKKFVNLTINIIDLEELKTINGIFIDEYVTLFGHRNLTEEIMFDNLIVTDVLQIDGEIIGLSDEQKRASLTLNETSVVSSDVVFAKLTILGDLEVENSLNAMKWSDLDDLIGINDRDVEITGRKTFLNAIEVASDLTIESRIINDRSIDEFVTLDTEQVFPNLEIISGNVTFNDVVRDDLEDLKNFLNQNLDESGQPECIEKSIRFTVPPIVEHLSLIFINGLSADDFRRSVDATFAKVHFQNVVALDVHAREISTDNLNGMNFIDLMERRISKSLPQELTGDYVIDVLNITSLNTQTINELSVDQLKKLWIELDEIYDGISNGSFSIDELWINGSVDTPTINGDAIQDIYSANSMGTVIFPNDVYVENLTLYGFFNDINITEFMNDVVVKTDADIVITGDKYFDRIDCEILDATKVNGIDVDRILDPNKHQTISTSVKVNGTVTILESFESLGKIGELYWQEIQERFRYLGNDTYSLSGDLRFTSEDTSVENLFVGDSIQEIPFNDFLNSVVYKNSTNVTVHGSVVFKDSVTIDSTFTITERFNELDLKYFYDNAVRIDRPFAVKSKISFTENILVEENLIVDEKLEAKTVGGVDLIELYEAAAFSDRPTFMSGVVTLENVVFESDIEVEIINDLDMSTVITLDSEQTWPATLHCLDIAVGNLEISGTFNGHDLSAIWDDTFKLTGNQNISGHIVIVGDVLMRHDFDANLINGMNPRNFISLDGNETLIGNFIFEKPLIVHGNILSRGLVNDVDVERWQATAVTKNFPFAQIINGAWKIRGNVHFENDVFGNALLDGVNVTTLENDLHNRRERTEKMAENIRENWTSMCKNLSVLKLTAENQMYKYKYLDYFQIFNFNSSIASVHHFEFGDSDYLFINFANCQLDLFIFAETKFVAIASVPDVGHVDRWFTMQFEEEIYFLTIGKNSCGRSTGNLWKITNDFLFTHVDDLGNVTDVRKISGNEFLLMIDGILVHRSLLQIYQRSLSRPRSNDIGTENLKFVSESSKLLIANRDYVYEYNSINGTVEGTTNYFGTDAIASFRLGVYQREIFVYYDENLSDDYLFISDDNVLQPKILQTIKTQQPSSFIVLNFDGLVENFLIFVENRQRLQIYEYRGIERFVYRETVDMNVEKILNFKIRKNFNVAKINFVAVLQERKLVLLEAKMYGTRLQMGSLPCEH